MTTSLILAEAGNSHNLYFILFSSFFLFPIASTLHQEDGDDRYDQCSVIYKLKDFIVEKM